MCGRGGMDFDWRTVWRYLSLAGDPPDGGERRLNIAPSTRRRDGVDWRTLPAVRSVDGERQVDALVWPLVPHWLKGDLPKFSTANCRSEADTPFAETVTGKPTFRTAWKRGQRCVVVLSWFYEWDQRTRPRQPWRVLPADGPVLTLAGLWDRSPTGEDSMMESCTIVTTQPNALLRDIGHHRAPVLLDGPAVEAWLDGSDDDAQAVVRPPPDDALRAHPVSARVNNPHYEEDDLLEASDGG